MQITDLIRRRTSWPIPAMLATALAMWFLFGLFTFTFDARNQWRAQFFVGVAACFIVRTLLALILGEENRSWVVWTVFIVASPAVWRLLEAFSHPIAQLLGKAGII